jgi:cysteine desulfurase
MESGHIYMDHNATTPLHPEVILAMKQAMHVYANPSSLHSNGRYARQRIEEARERLARFINARPQEIVFTGSGTEGNNTVLNIMREAIRTGMTTRTRLVTSTIEHPAVLETAGYLEKLGIDVRYCPVDETGRIDMDRLRELVDDNTFLVSIMIANNEIGTVQDSARIARIAHAQGALYHTDAVQALGKIDLDTEALGIDYMTVSAHKIYGPKGVGALYAAAQAPWFSFMRGGHQEQQRRASTENTLGITGFGTAVDMRAREMDSEYHRLSRLRVDFIDAVGSAIPDIRVNGHPHDSLPGTVNISFKGAEGEAILLYLDLEGIAVSTGSACASGSLDPSHVLLATGLGPEFAHGSIRFSFGRSTTKKEIERVSTALTSVIQKVRAMSTAYQGGSQ